MLSSLPRWLPLTIITLAALGLRTHDLARRPMHADEANQAVKAGELLETGRYEFDPRDHHGPTLYYATLPLAWLRGQRTLAELTETTVRMVPALAGTLSVVLLATLAAPLGPWAMIASSAFLAMAPAAVYYSRDFIQETLLLMFALGGLVSARLWWRDGRVRWAIAAGVFGGLMQATKASAPLFAVAGLLAALAAGASRPASGRLGRDVGLALGTAVAVAALLYSSFGAHPSGIRDAFVVYSHGWNRATGPSGHEKSWWYYLSLFGWIRQGGLLWQQLAFSAAALTGAIAAFFLRHPLLRWALVYTSIVCGSLSFVAYKTPWHVIHLVPGMAILAGGSLVALRRLPFGRIIAPAASVVILGFLAQQTRLSSFLRPADARNPLAYVQSSPDVLKIRPLAEAALQRSPAAPMRIISEEYWPLPWYLRGLPRVGYWSTAPLDCDGALLVVSAAQADLVRARLQNRYRESFLGLRPGQLSVVFTPE